MLSAGCWLMAGDVLTEQIRIGHVIVIEEQQQTAGGDKRAEVLCRRYPGRRQTDTSDRQLRREAHADVLGPVGRPIVDDDHFEVGLGQRLSLETPQRSSEEMRPISCRDDHRQHRWMPHGTSLAKSIRLRETPGGRACTRRASGARCARARPADRHSRKTSCSWRQADGCCDRPGSRRRFPCASDAAVIR